MGDDYTGASRHRSSDGAVDQRVARPRANTRRGRAFHSAAVLLCAATAFLALGAASAPAALVHPLLSSFGSFNFVAGVAVDQSTEDVYVYDTNEEKIYKYTASGEPAEFSSTKTDAISGVSAAGGASEAELAVDDSSSSAKGDVYLSHGGTEGIEIFNEAGEKVGALTEEAGVPWGETCGVAVDSTGNVYVGIYEGEINKYVPNGGTVTNSDYAESIGVNVEPCNLAVDSAFNVFGALYETGVYRWTASEFGSSGVAGTVVDTSGSSLAVDPGNAELYVDQENKVVQYGPHGEPFKEPVSEFGAGAINSSFGISVNGKTHDVYVADRTKVNVYGPGELTPTSTTGNPKTVHETTAVVTGSVNPEGSPLTACVFEYGESESSEHSVPCAETAGQIGAGSKAVPVEAELTGLTRATFYYYRLVVTTATGEYQAPNDNFVTAGPPVIVEQGIVEDTSGEATVTATINPEWQATSYRVEYGATESYGQSTVETELPEVDQKEHTVYVSLSGLTAGTLYHFRFVATNSGGETIGSDQLLTTFAPTMSELPDGRGYEQVTPEEKFGTEVYQPEVEPNYAYEVEVKHQTESNTQTSMSFQAAADGSGLAYVEGPTIGGNEAEGFGSGNEYLGTRSPSGGWSEKLLSPEGAASSIFEAFSPNLGTAFVSSSQPLSPTVPGYGEAKKYEEENFQTLYTVSTAGGEYVPFDTVRPPYREPGEFGTVLGTARRPSVTGEGGCKFGACLALEGVSADGTHLLFAANDALTGASEGRPAAEGGASGSEFRRKNNLYESVNGQLRLVNVLPDGTTHAGATAGAVVEENENRPEVAFSHAVSANGSRIFWTDTVTHHIYMRENGTRTVEISPSGKYWTATDNGSTVYYTNGDLYAYDVETEQTTDLTPGVSVSRVAGASENGEYVYYLTSALQLDVWHDGVSKVITTDPEATEFRAQVTPDGHSIVFMTTFQKKYPIANFVLTHHVEVYDAETETLNCASCTSLGASGSLQVTNSENVYQPRWISANGARVFFVSFEGLVPQDDNEEQDVYEWERDGSGSCTQSSGCVYVLSGGKSAGQSSFLDASESGDDVFIVTMANLDGTDVDGAYDIYDVRVGAKPAPAAPACTGTGCQGVPPAPPIFAAPPTLTFTGLGNFPAPAPSVTVKKTTTPKKTAKCKKGFVRKKNKCIKKKKAKARKASNDRRAKR